MLPKSAYAGLKLSHNDVLLHKVHIYTCSSGHFIVINVKYRILVQQNMTLT